MLKAKISAFLKKAGTIGATRSRLLHKYACRAADLDRILPSLVESGEIVEWLTTPPKAKGRPVMTYYNKEAAADLTPPQEPDIPVAPEPGSSTRSSPCKVCGRAVPWPDVGRPYVYCSRACRRAAHDGGITMREFISRAQEPRTFTEVAILLVMADLRMRGFRIARDFFISGPRILVNDNEGACFLDVVPIGLDGHFPDPQEYDSMAGVYRDGSILYGGRNPLVPAEPRPTAIAASTVDGKQEAAASDTPEEQEVETAPEADEDVNAARLEDEPDPCPGNGDEDPWAAMGPDPDEGDR
jgi:hypothetical protein